MKVRIESAPCMILETVELLYAFVNQIPAQELTTDGDYSIPCWNVQRILNECCAGLSAQDSMLQHYFTCAPLLDESGGYTCLARNIAYDALSFSSKTLEDAGRFLRQSWKTTKAGGDRPMRITSYNMDYSKSQEVGYTPLATYMERLLVPADYQRKLLEAFAGFDDAVEELIGLLSPVARKLEQHLAPWVERAESLREQWLDYLSQPENQTKLFMRCQVSTASNCEAINLCLRFLDCSHTSGQLLVEDSSLNLHVGVGLSIHPEEKQELAAWEYKALRLLGSPARVRMLQATMDRPMTSREISQELKMHLGAVGRDVSSLFDARLLIVELVGGKSRYRADPAALDTLSRHLAALKQK